MVCTEGVTGAGAGEAVVIGVDFTHCDPETVYPELQVTLDVSVPEVKLVTLHVNVLYEVL